MITEDSPSGSRGIVAVRPISAEDIALNGPPLRVPEALYMTAESAVENLQPRIDEHTRQWQAAGAAAWLLSALGGGGGGGPPPVAEVDPMARVALLLAYERTKGPDSFWAPYIACLPATPPCAWHMDPQRLEAALRGIARSTEARGTQGGSGSGSSTTSASAGPPGWEAAVRRAGGVARARAASLAKAYGPALGVDAEGVAWALGHVVSRAFGGHGGNAALAPLIDSCNHRAGAAKPSPLLADGQDGGVEGDGGGVVVCIVPEQEGRLVGMEAGEELCISYGAIDGDAKGALGVFISFGFVPGNVQL